MNHNGMHHGVSATELVQWPLYVTKVNTNAELTNV
jgi:hypothetical protein